MISDLNDFPAFTLEHWPLVASRQDGDTIVVCLGHINTIKAYLYTHQEKGPTATVNIQCHGKRVELGDLDIAHAPKNGGEACNILLDRLDAAIGKACLERTNIIEKILGVLFPQGPSYIECTQHHAIILMNNGREDKQYSVPTQMKEWVMQMRIQNFQKAGGMILGKRSTSAHEYLEWHAWTKASIDITQWINDIGITLDRG